MPAFGVAASQFLSRDQPAAEIARCAIRAEELGFESLWVMDGIVTDQPCLEPLALLGYLAAVTETITLGAGVIVAPLRSPVVLAKAFATIDRLCDGRLVAGIGLGDDSTPYAAFGGSREERVARLEEAATVMRRLWTEPAVTHAGRFVHLNAAPLEPKPSQQHLPLWFGGGAPAAIRRAVRLADGWLGAGASSTDDFRDRSRTVRELLDGRSTPFSIGKRCYVMLDRSRERAVERARPFFGAIYGAPDLADRVLVGGTVEECAEQLAAVADCDPDLILVNPISDELAHLECIAADVIPALR